MKMTWTQIAEFPNNKLVGFFKRLLKLAHQDHDPSFFETNLLSLLRDVGRSLASEIEGMHDNHMTAIYLALADGIVDNCLTEDQPIERLHRKDLHIIIQLLRLTCQNPEVRKYLLLHAKLVI